MGKSNSGDRWRALNGGSYPRPGRPKTGPGSKEEVRFEAGAELRGLPLDVVGSLLANNLIEPWGLDPVLAAPTANEMLPE